MKIRLDNVLLCILWLLAITLGTCFWFNIAFGFNVFSAEHWEYVSALQAARTPIKPGFYVSMATSIFLTIFGLYVVVRPRFRNIKMPIIKIDKKPITIINQNQTDNTNQKSDASTIDVLPAEQQHTIPHANNAPPASARPPRLTLPTLNGNYISPVKEPVLSQDNPFATNVYTQQNQTADWSEIRDIFKNAGYTVKPNTKVNGLQTALIAIGTNEVMWLGCVGVKTTEVRKIIEKFQQVFMDTLDETEIEINGFAIAAPDAATSEFQDILMFNSISELRTYMSDKQNPPLPEDDDGMFEAYSQYIDAVITHIGKI